MTRESAQKHAALIRAFTTGHEIECQLDETDICDKSEEPGFYAAYHYRLALPPHKSYHNPENITEEQLGKDHRFCLLEELDGRFDGIAEEYYGGDGGWKTKAYATYSQITYRVPIETLFPSGPPTPKTRPFTVDDITPNMVFRSKRCGRGFALFHSVEDSGIQLNESHFINWITLEEGFLYSTDGKTFHPCSVNL